MEFSNRVHPAALIQAAPGSDSFLSLTVPEASPETENITWPFLPSSPCLLPAWSGPPTRHCLNSLCFFYFFITEGLISLVGGQFSLTDFFFVN